MGGRRKQFPAAKSTPLTPQEEAEIVNFLRDNPDKPISAFNMIRAITQQSMAETLPILRHLQAVKT